MTSWLPSCIEKLAAERENNFRGAKLNEISGPRRQGRPTRDLVLYAALRDASRGLPRGGEERYPPILHDELVIPSHCIQQMEKRQGGVQP